MRLITRLGIAHIYITYSTLYYPLLQCTLILTAVGFGVVRLATRIMHGASVVIVLG